MKHKTTSVFKRIIRGYIPYYITRVLNPKSKFLPYYEYIKKYGDAHHLYLFAHEYKDFKADIHYDDESMLYYAVLPGTNKHMYFERGMGAERSKGYTKALILEQDYRSPHRYYDNVDELKGKILLDIGAAEGVLSLMAIELVEHVYLFECDESWSEALSKTFEPWKSKVTIVNKFVGDHDDDNTIKLDSFFLDKPHKDLFVKMDIEGMERFALAGSDELFSEAGNVTFSICTYHRHDDFKIISSFLDKHKCMYSNYKGYWSHRMKSVMLRGKN